MAKQKTDLDSTVMMPAPRRPAVRVSGYRIVRKLGEGGMGEVYEAEQQQPIRRRVALKVIKRGMDTAAVIARFESERQALALMDHPSIAHIFDAGVTERGRPFFAMEFVDGMPVTEYCDDHRLTVRERIELFVGICQGVHHAHQKGMIHNDLKPSNVLLTIRDDHPVPKIIDFGIAKAIGRPLTEDSGFVEPGQLIGTPEYMSPEQAETAVLDVDTRSDVYSLGVLIYRLLVGVLPFEPVELRKLLLDEPQSRFRENPPTPSTRLCEMEAETSTRIAGERQSGPQDLVKRLRGDLDRIVMKALEKDRARRYGSASDFAADLVRYLEDRPVEAGPSSKIYQMRKFVRRHRLGVAAAGLVLLTLVLGIAGTTVSLLRATEAEARATQEAETARQVSEFLAGLFASSDPYASNESVETLTALHMLERGKERLQTELSGQPTVRARLLDTIGEVYRNVALYDEAELLLTQSLAVREALSPDGLEVAESLSTLGWLYRTQGREGLAESHLRRALEIREKQLDADHPDVAASLHLLATFYKGQGRYDESEELFLRALTIFEQALGPEDELVGAVLSDFGLLKWKQGLYAEAQTLFERSVALGEKTLEPDNPNFAGRVNNLGLILAVQGKYPEALPLFQRSLAIREKALGPDHPDVSPPVSNLALLYMEMDRGAEALPLFQRALAILETSLGPDHPRVVEAVSNLADFYASEGRSTEAEPLYRRALAFWGRVQELDRPAAAYPLLGLANLYRDQARHAEAEPLYQRALAIREKLLGLEHPETREVLADYAAMLRAADRDAEAAELEARVPAEDLESRE